MVIITDLKCISSDNCIGDQDSKKDESLDEPDERLFAVEDPLLLNEAPFSRSSPFFACHRQRSQRISHLNLHSQSHDRPSFRQLIVCLR